MSTPLEPAGSATDQKNRQVVAGVHGAVGYPRPIEDCHVVQQRAVAVGRRLELLEILREELHVVAVDLGHVRDQLGHIVVV